jgi:pimeloyl-ACP methyl ester carboxylesterase
MVREGLAFGKIALNQFRAPVRVQGAGRGQPIIVIPGMLSGDASTSFLRRSLRASGFDARASGLLLNSGATPRRVESIQRRISSVRKETGKAVTLIGWSLGGLYARLLGHRCSGEVQGVITLGSPFSGDPRANNAWRLYEAINRHEVSQSPFPEDISVKPPVLTVAFWSPNDGVVAPYCARGEANESDLQIELSARHFEMAASAPCVRQIIQVLAELEF